MQNEENLIKSKPNENKTVLFWYSAAVIIVLFFTLFPAVNYSNPWDNSLKTLETAINESDPAVKQKMLKSGGEELASVIKKYPDHPKLNMIIGYYYFAIGKMDSVIYHERKALNCIAKDNKNEIYSKSSDLLVNATVNKGISLISQGDTTGAFKLYANSVRLVPGSSRINKNIASFYISQNKPEAALFHYYSALKADKNDTEAMTGLANSYLIMGSTDSVKFYSEKILERNPSDANAQYLLNTIKR